MKCEKDSKYCCFSNYFCGIKLRVSIVLNGCNDNSESGMDDTRCFFRELKHFE